MAAAAMTPRSVETRLRPSSFPGVSFMSSSDERDFRRTIVIRSRDAAQVGGRKCGGRAGTPVPHGLIGNLFQLELGDSKSGRIAGRILGPQVHTVGTWGQGGNRYLDSDWDHRIAGPDEVLRVHDPDVKFLVTGFLVDDAELNAE